MAVFEVGVSGKKEGEEGQKGREGEGEEPQGKTGPALHCG